MLALLDKRTERTTFLFLNFYFFGKDLQIFLKKCSFFFSLWDQAFSSEKTLTLIIIGALLIANYLLLHYSSNDPESHMPEDE